MQNGFFLSQGEHAPHDDCPLFLGVWLHCGWHFDGGTNDDLQPA
ncbi:hypothetical protein [Lignipirellula cremea]|nr:hypothetical protein [Lignipirellula cremea]